MGKGGDKEVITEEEGIDGWRCGMVHWEEHHYSAWL